MKKVIHYLRRQPEETRRHVLHGVTIACAAILLLLWIYSLGTSLADEDTEAKFKQDIEPFSVLKDSIPNSW